ncbi:DUF3302 domain-containing protein [Vibrio maerlii]|uniref:DUF3302 domain-containing protein n=1 Tax=Vibrio maerlii TaxID=2231648 RepID=UPI000E3E5040|nr:DUF3302 domain-containing protein [Vibrio maerlii]
MLEYFALFLVFFVFLTIFYGIIVIHDIPYEIAHKRNHPHQDAIHVAGWVSLFTLHAIWPFLWIWATLYKPGIGWGMSNPSRSDTTILELEQLKQEMVELKAQINEDKKD